MGLKCEEIGLFKARTAVHIKLCKAARNLLRQHVKQTKRGRQSDGISEG